MVRAASSAAPGLYTGVNPDLAPPGSLQQAYGLVCKRPGLLQKQRPFRQYSSGHDSAFNFTFPSIGIGYTIAASGRLLLTSAGGNLWMEGLSGGAGTGVFTSTGALANVRLRTAEANGNTYIRGKANATPSAAGAYVGMLRLGSGDQVRSAGVPRALDLYLTDQAGTLIPTTGQSVAYRATLYSLDDNGNRITGAPSGRAVFTTTADNRDVVLKMFLPFLLILGDGTKFRWEVWRSKVFAVATAPDDELQLVADYGISSADLAAGYVTFTDNTPDAMRADALYTNPSQDGIGFANDPPPVFNDLAYFKNFMLLANTYQKQRAMLQILGAPEEWKIQSIAANSPAAGQSTYTFLPAVDLSGFGHTFKLSVAGSTSGANDGVFAIAAYTSGSFVDGIDNTNHKVVVTNAGVDQAGVLGSAVSGKFVTVANAVTSVYYPTYQVENAASHHFQVPNLGSALALIVKGMAESLIRVINQDPVGGVVGYNAVDDPLGAPGKILFEEISIGGGNFTVYALGTSTAAYVNTYSNKFAPTIAQSAPLTSVNDARTNRVHYSKYGEPEHFPIAQFLDIGSRSANILRMVALRDAVLVFKEDGLFRITSDGVNLFWSVVDPTQLLIAEELVASLHNVAVAVTSRGVWLFSEVGAEYVSGPVQDLLDKCIQPNSTGPFPGRDISSNALSRVTVSPNDGLVYIYLNKNNTVAATDAVGLVYSLQTRVWAQQWANATGYGSTPPDGVTGQVNFAELAYTYVNGMRIGVHANSINASYDIYIEDQYALIGSIFAEYASGLLGNQKAADPVPGHKYLIDVTGVTNGSPRTITAKSLGGPGLAVGTYVRCLQGGTIYKITSVGTPVAGYSVCALLPVYGSVETIAPGRLYYYADQPASWGYQTFVAGDDATVKQWIEARLSLDPKSTISAGSVTMYTYTEAGDGSPQSDSGPPAAPSTLVRLGVESKSQAGRMISVFCSHQNKLEFLYIRGMAYSFEVVEDDRADV